MPTSYDWGYASRPCFWGKEPATLVRRVATCISDRPSRILDLGCGDGKNSAYLSALGHEVLAIDSSELAICNAKAAWPDSGTTHWLVKDMTSLVFDPLRFRVVIATGSLHLLRHR